MHIDIKISNKIVNLKFSYLVLMIMELENIMSKVFTEYQNTMKI